LDINLYLTTICSDQAPNVAAFNQNNVFNRSRINTVVVCALTSNLKRAQAPGNVLLENGEANLPRQSVVNVSQIFTVDKRDLVEKIGTLSRQRVRQILDGIRLLTEPRDVDK
jgi:mRNA interferase MazF